MRAAAAARATAAGRQADLIVAVGNGRIHDANASHASRASRSIAPGETNPSK